MVVVRQDVSNNVAFSADGVAPFTFVLKKREDLTEKNFQMNPVETLRVPVFEWSVVTDLNQEDIPEGFIYLSAGQYDYTVEGTNGVLPASGILRVDVFVRAKPTEYNVEETFKVYGQ